MNKRKFYLQKRAFTLIELLAIIIILAIILLIVMPIVLNVIGESRKKAFESSAYGLTKTAENYYMEASITSSIKETVVYTFVDGIQSVEPDSYEILEFSGEPPVSGQIKINIDGDIEMAITDGIWCAIKEKTKRKINELVQYDENCKLTDELGQEEEEVEEVYFEDVIVACLIDSSQCEGVDIPAAYIATVGTWIPVANANELNNIRLAETNVFGTGTVWQGEYVGGLNKRYLQVKHIDMSEYENWQPIGNSSIAFTGSYFGNHYIINNLTVNRSDEDNVGFFGVMSSGDLFGLRINNVNIVGRSFTGAIIGRVSGTAVKVNNCRASGDIKGTTNTGGVAGQMWNNSDMQTQLVFAGTVNGTDSVGGLVGLLASNAHISHSYSIGTVYATGLTGGLVGRTGSGGKLSNCYSRVNIYSTGTVGGLIGQHYNSRITNCYAANTQDRGGGLVGSQYLGTLTVINSYWDRELSLTTGTYGGLGTSKTTLELKNIENFENWDFDNTWYIDENRNEGYPFNIIYPKELYIGFIPVANADELNRIRFSENNLFGLGTDLEGEYLGGLDKRYIQMNNIDLSDYSNWQPIGDTTNRFTGFYWGNNYSINDLTINRPTEDNIALFGVLNRGRIYDLKLFNTNIVGRDGVGSLLGQSLSTTVRIDNCHAEGTVQGRTRVGGLAGQIWNNTDTQSQLSFIGNVSGTTDNSGILIGFLASSTRISDCYAIGNVVGGSNSGSIAGTGGLAGANGSGARITNCYVRGSIHGGNNNTGGLLGKHYGSIITNSYVSVSQNRGGGLIGTQYLNSPTVVNSYWNQELSGILTTYGNAGEGKSTSALKSEATFIGWDFDNIWNIDVNKNNGYPYLRWQD